MRVGLRARKSGARRLYRLYRDPSTYHERWVVEVLELKAGFIVREVVQMKDGKLGLRSARDRIIVDRSDAGV